ncbi:hypothetical protein F4777DRAFT_527642 [Nemania sp. FL0916]|nr:hypothetical protein F4777DRAFT_527642 [Nemania sp. FL0916]
MDPFRDLPPELRLQILLYTPSRRSIQQLIQASPTMLAQYLVYKEYIDWNLLVTEANLDDDMVQDAMAIILFPPRNNAGLVESIPQRDHFFEWSNKRFPNPLTNKPPINGKDKSLVQKIVKLYYRLLVFIEDYITKATAACPSREYLCLPHPSGQLTFKDRPVCTIIDVTQCNSSERRRLLRAFLKYEAISKFCSNRHDSALVQQCYRLRTRFGPWAEEAVFCVELYLGSLYRALLAQCGDSDLPENPPAIHTDQMPREVSCSPDWTHLSAEQLIFWTSRSLNADELCPWLGCLGFDLAMILVAGITAGPRGRTLVGQWFKHAAKRGPRCGQHRSWRSRRPGASLLIGPGSGAVTGEGPDGVICLAGPDLYRMLYPGLRTRNKGEPHSLRSLCQDNALFLYRSRAWVFFDDVHLFKAHGDGPHFPADEITFPPIQFHDIIGPSHDYGESHDVEDSEGFSLEIEMRNLSKVLQDFHIIPRSFLV